MKRNLKKFLLLIISIAFIIVLVSLFRNRYIFGVWNPMSLPNRIECYERRYYIAHSSPQALKDDQEPKCSISAPDNRTGKEVYIMEPKGELVPTVIFLKTTDGKYQQYELSGGP